MSNHFPQDFDFEKFKMPIGEGRKVNILNITAQSPSHSEISFDSGQFSLKGKNGIYLELNRMLAPAKTVSMVHHSEMSPIESDTVSTLMSLMSKKVNHQISNSCNDLKAKRFQCPFANCGSSFHNRGHLDRHLRVHTGERPFACQYQGCTKKFSRRILHYLLKTTTCYNTTEHIYILPKCLAKNK